MLPLIIISLPSPRHCFFDIDIARIAPPDI